MNETTAPVSSMVIDFMMIGCLLVAICMGGLLLWQIMTLRKERFRFDQMTQALAGQMAIFQSVMASGREDLEVKIARLNKAVDQGRSVSDELHVLIEAANNMKSATVATARQASQNAPVQQPQQRRADPLFDEVPVEAPRPMFAIVDPEFEPETKEDSRPAVDDFADLTPSDRAELAQLATPAEKALMAALKRAGRR